MALENLCFSCSQGDLTSSHRMGQRQYLKLLLLKVLLTTIKYKTINKNYTS